MWGGGPVHPYLDQRAAPTFGPGADAAQAAQRAAGVLGSGLVDARLQEAARFGGERQVQEAARRAEAESFYVMDQARRHHQAVVASRTVASPAIPAARTTPPIRSATAAKAPIAAKPATASSTPARRPVNPGSVDLSAMFAEAERRPVAPGSAEASEMYAQISRMMTAKVAARASTIPASTVEHEQGCLVAEVLGAISICLVALSLGMMIF